MLKEEKERWQVCVTKRLFRCKRNNRNMYRVQGGKFHLCRGGCIMKKIPLATPTMHGEEQKYIQEAF